VKTLAREVTHPAAPTTCEILAAVRQRVIMDTAQFHEHAPEAVLRRIEEEAQRYVTMLTDGREPTLTMVRTEGLHTRGLTPAAVVM
jgi:hypothetical protein